MQQVLIRATVIASVVAAFSTNPGATTPRREEHSRAAAAKAIDALDRCVQERFVRIDKGFGLSRISEAMHNTRQFVPTNDVESHAVGDFEALGLRVVTYVASRQLPRFGPLGGRAIPPVIQGPVFVSLTPHVLTRNLGGAPREVRADPQVMNDLPNDADVRAQGLLVLNAPAAAESSQFAIGRWSFVARPVRASASACLHCHNYRPANAAGSSVGESVEGPFRMGDPIGAVLYGYQSERSVR